jgi:hypothetical protein
VLPKDCDIFVALNILDSFHYLHCLDIDEILYTLELLEELGKVCFPYAILSKTVATWLFMSLDVFMLLGSVTFGILVTPLKQSLPFNGINTEILLPLVLP